MRKDEDNGTVVLCRTKGPPWTFNYAFEYDGWVYRGRKHVYRIMIDPDHLCSKAIWIGMLVGDGAWVTVEREIGAHHMDLWPDLRVSFFRED